MEFFDDLGEIGPSRCEPASRAAGDRASARPAGGLEADGSLLSSRVAWPASGALDAYRAAEQMAECSAAPMAVVAAGLNGASTLQCFTVADDGALTALCSEVHAGMQTMYAAASPVVPILHVVDINCVKDPVHGRAEQGLLKSWAVSDAGALQLVGTVPSGGVTPCHNGYVAGGPGEPDVVVVANYGDELSNTPGNLAVFPVAGDGTLGESVIRTVAVPGACSAQREGDDAATPGNASPATSSTIRQTVAHPHMCVVDPSSEVVYSVDLGANAIVGYRLSRSPEVALSEQPVVICELHAGAGPRHLVFHPTAPAAFSVNELDSTVSVFAFDGATKSLKETAHLRAVPGRWTNADSNRVNAPAAVAVSACGRWLYASNRGHDSLAVFEIHLPDPIGGDGVSIAYVQSIPSGGSLPWSFAGASGSAPPPCVIDDLVLVQNQGAQLTASVGYTQELAQPGNITAMRLDSESGMLRPTGAVTHIAHALFVAALPLWATYTRSAVAPSL